MAAFGPPQSAVPLSGPVVLPDSHARGILFLPREVIMKVRWLCQYNLIVSCHEAQRIKVAGKKKIRHIVRCGGWWCGMISERRVPD